jgi:hypothetical protein
VALSAHGHTFDDILAASYVTGAGFFALMLRSILLRVGVLGKCQRHAIRDQG